MQATNLESIITTLSPLTKQHFERGIQLCVSLKHPQILPLHLLVAALNHDHPQKKELIMPLEKSLATITKTAEDFPVISQQLISLSQIQHNNPQSSLLYLIIQSQDIQAIYNEDSKQNQLLCDLDQLYKSTANGKISPLEYKSSLDQFALNFNQLASQGKFAAAIGRNREIGQLIDILLRKKSNNPLLVGEPGVGKTAIIEGLALNIVNNAVPKQLQNTTLYSLDLTALQAGSNMKGEYEQRVKKLINDIQSADKASILFIDELHMMMKQSDPAAGIANILKPALARGELRTIGATTWSEYKQYIEPDKALTRRFQLLKINEPSDNDLLTILKVSKASLENHHGVIIDDSALEVTIKLARRYITDRQFPDKALSLLDSACAKVSLLQQSLPLNLSEKKDALQHKITELNNLVSNSTLFPHAKKRASLDKEIKTIKEEIIKMESSWRAEEKLIRQLKKLLKNTTDSNSQAVKALLKTYKDNKYTAPLCVSKSILYHVIHEWTQIPLAQLKQSNSRKIKTVKKALEKNILGQEHAIQAIITALSIKQENDSEAPLGAYIFSGPSGTGKTQAAKIIAKQLFIKPENITTINMNEFKESHKISMLLGSPPGYVDSQKGGLLTESIKRHPHHIMILDEIEKAHPDIHEVFMQIFDQGFTRDSQGNTINCSNTLFIMTSNIHAKLNESHNHNYSDIKNNLSCELAKQFSQAFIGRIDVIPFESLSIEIATKIAKIKLENRLNRYYKKSMVADMIASKSLRDILSESNFKHLGVRGIEKSIDNMLSHLQANPQ